MAIRMSGHGWGSHQLRLSLPPKACEYLDHQRPSSRIRVSVAPQVQQAQVSPPPYYAHHLFTDSLIPDKLRGRTKYIGHPLPAGVISQMNDPGFRCLTRQVRDYSQLITKELG